MAAVATHPFTPIAALAPDTYYGASCPSTATCLAVGKDATGQPILSTSTDSGATWRTTHQAVQFPLGLITCTSPAHCIGAQNTGTSDVFVVSDNAGASWQSAPSPPLNALHSASCPTVSDCQHVSAAWSGSAVEPAGESGGPRREFGQFLPLSDRGSLRHGNCVRGLVGRDRLRGNICRCGRSGLIHIDDRRLSFAGHEPQDPEDDVECNPQPDDQTGTDGGANVLRCVAGVLGEGSGDSRTWPWRSWTST